MEFRYDLINQIIQKHGYKSYLEIGTQNSICGSNVKCEYKAGIDPDPINRIQGDFDKHFNGTSDDFFNINNEKFDIIFIDGLHTYEQVSDDFFNSLRALNEHGCIVLHDCLPTTEERAKSFSEGGVWNGDCFRFIQDLEDNNVKFYVADFDQGCAVIYKNDLKVDGMMCNNGNLSFSEWQSKLKTKKILNANDIINISM